MSKNWVLGFSNSIRYDYLGGFNQIEADFGARPENRGLIFGFHFYWDYHFKVFRKSEIFLRLGISLLNRGTQIDSKQTFFDEEGNLLGTLGSATDYAYEPYNFGIGWKKRKTEIMLAFYSSGNSPYFSENESFIIPYFKFSYNLGRL